MLLLHTIKIIDSVFQIILHIMVVSDIVSAKNEFIKAFSKPRLGIINLSAFDTSSSAVQSTRKNYNGFPTHSIFYTHIRRNNILLTLCFFCAPIPT